MSNDAARAEIARVLADELYDAEEARRLAEAIVRGVDWAEVDR